MYCRDVMTCSPITCTPEASAVEAARLMESHDVGSLPVVRDPQGRVLVGMVTDRDLALRVVGSASPPDATPVGKVMSPSVVACREDHSYLHAVKTMAEHRLRRLPVVDAADRLVGIIAQADIARRGAEQETTGALVEAISEPTTTEVANP